MHLLNRFWDIYWLYKQNCCQAFDFGKRWNKCRYVCSISLLKLFWQKYCEKTQASYRIFIWMLRVLAAYFIINHELTDDYVCTGEIVYCSIHLNISFKIFEENLLSSDLIVVKTNKKSPWILVIAHKLFLIPLQPKRFSDPSTSLELELNCYSIFWLFHISYNDFHI